MTIHSFEQERLKRADEPEGVDVEAPRPDPNTIDFEALAFSGDRLLEVEQRPQGESPLPGYFDPEPGLQLIAGRSASGKTTFALQLTICWANGSAPWDGAPQLPGTRSLFISREQRISRIVRRAIAVARTPYMIKHVNRAIWMPRTSIVARDRDLPRELRPLLTLDDLGLEYLDTWLRRARMNGDPFGLVTLDSATRLKPPDAETNSNDDMTTWLDGIHDIGERNDAWMNLLHHQGHSERMGERGAGRGATAFDDVPQVVMEIKRIPGERAFRTIRVYGNGVDDAAYSFRVAPETDPGKVLHWSPEDPNDSALPTEYLHGGESITAEDLAWRISGQVRPGESVDGKRVEPPRAAQARARLLREQWEEAGLIDVVRNGRRLEIRLANTGAESA